VLAGAANGNVGKGHGGACSGFVRRCQAGCDAAASARRSGRAGTVASCDGY
jgi:hypothetical protein